MHTPHDDTPAEPKWRRYLRFFRPNPAADLQDELRDHLESMVEELVARGMTPEAARAEAHRRFGDVSRIRGEVERLDETQLTRERRTVALESFLHDVRYAARGLRRSIGFTLVATISIALGVAANATMFSVVNAVLFRPIPGAHAERLVRVYENHHSPLTWTQLAWFRAHTTAFDGIVGERYGAMGFRGAPGAEAERIQTSYVTQGFFPALGVRMALGRAFDVSDSADASASSVAVISHRFWERRFAGDSSIVGRRVALSEHPITIVGVTAPDFRSSVLGWTPDMLVPIAMAPALTGTRLQDFGGSLYTTARLRVGVAPSAGEAELRGALAQLARTDSAAYDRTTVRIGDVRGVNAEQRAGVTIGSVFLMAMVGMVLLIACANVANLVLGRAATRRTELGVRLAIGASRGRIVRQMLTESLLLAFVGSAVGFAGALLLTRLLPAALPPQAGLDASYFQPDLTVALFTGALCLVTTVLFGLMPALHASSPQLTGLLKGDDPHARRRSRRGALVVTQAALCVLLLAVASLFLRSLASSRDVDPGFRADGVVDVDVDLGLLGPGVKAPAVFANIVRDASSLPSVQSASLAAVVPLGGSNMETRVVQDGMTLRSRGDAPAVYFNVVTPKFFATLRTPILRGREFLPTDGESSPHVAVINETAARRLWPAGDALGKRFRLSGDNTLYEVVGISRDANYVMPGESPKATVYFAFSQMPRSEMTLQLRTSAPLATIRSALWSVVRASAPTLPPPPVVTMTDDMSITLLPVRLGAGLLGAFGGLALVLAAAGIYGVASYSVASRTREIGIRAALGATRARLVRMVLWESGRRVVIGSIIGLGATIGIAAGLARVLYGVEAVDPVVLLSVIVTMAAVAVIASLAPAVRAANADPVTSIRAD